MRILKVLIRCTISRSNIHAVILIFLAIILQLFVISEANEVEVTSASAQTTTTLTNSTDTAAEESSVQLRKVRNNVIRYGAIYRGNSTNVRRDRASRIFTKRPKVSRKDRHRHSTKVDTTKLPIVLLPPLLTFKRNDNKAVENHEPFVINVVTPDSSLTTAPSQEIASSSLSPTTFDQSPASPSRSQSDYTSPQTKSQRPYVDDKIMAMKNFGIRMKSDGVRGNVRFQSTTTVSGLTEGTSGFQLTDYTPPPAQYPSEHRLRQIGKQNPKRRPKSKSKTTTYPSTSSTAAVPESTQASTQNYSEDYVTNHAYQQKDTSTFTTEQAPSYESIYNNATPASSFSSQDASVPPVIDFRNSSHSDVLNYDIQRTSPRSGFVQHSPVSQNYVVNTQTSLPQAVEGNNPQTTSTQTVSTNFAPQTYVHSDSPQNFENSFSPNEAVSVSSPGTPSDYYGDYISSQSQDPNSFTPRTEINVATSTSQHVKSSPQISVDYEDFDLRDLFFQPLTILAPPFLEDEFHDSFGNVIANATQLNQQTQGQEYQTTPFPEVFYNGINDYVENHISPQAEGFKSPTPASSLSQNNTQPSVPDSAYSDNVSTENFISSSTEATSQQPASSRITDCAGGNCKQEPTFIKPWTKIPPTPSDVKVLSEEEGLELINKMYENLLRVLEGGTDYFDLQEDPQDIQGNDLQDISNNEHQVLKNQQENRPQNKPNRGSRKHDGQRKSSENNLIAEESGDIRNERERARLLNQVSTPTGRRNSRRKDVHDKSLRQEVQGKTERKAAQLCSSKLGYVADISTGCKMFYICTEYGVGEPMFCPNGTLFNQDYLVCDWWYNVECS